jgi:hypothetical protein
MPASLLLMMDPDRTVELDSTPGQFTLQAVMWFVSSMVARAARLVPMNVFAKPCPPAPEAAA